MKELSLSETGFLLKAEKQTRKVVFLAGMETVVPRSGLEGLIEPFYPKKGEGCLSDAVGCDVANLPHAALFGHFDLVMEEALHDVPQLRRFAGLDAFTM